MKRVDIYVRVEVDLDEEEPPDRVIREICRHLEKLYAVRKAELTNAIVRD